MKSHFSILLVALLSVSCKEPFEPGGVSSNKSILVVEGYINTGGGNTAIKLSRSSKLRDNIPVPEPGALIRVLGQDGSFLEAKTDISGIANLATKNINSAQKYKLYIKTSYGQEYQTAFLENTLTPEIDDVGYKVKDFGLQLFVNTHDMNNKTRYYIWTYEETWEIYPSFQSDLKVVNRSIINTFRNVYDEVCWGYEKSRSINIATSKNLAEDRISEAPLIYIKGNTMRLNSLYSIKVNQYGLTKEAYDFFKEMKKNTEQIGTIFDPQPTELKGNIQCISDPEEQVMGYISAGKVAEKRIFISSADKPKGPEWRFISCTSTKLNDRSVADILGSGYLPIYFDDVNGGFVWTRAECLDCTRIGSKTKPQYWPN